MYFAICRILVEKENQMCIKDVLQLLWLSASFTEYSNVPVVIPGLKLNLILAIS
jgi:hypothetical protein